MTLPEICLFDTSHLCDQWSIIFEVMPRLRPLPFQNNLPFTFSEQFAMSGWITGFVEMPQVCLDGNLLCE